MDKPFARSEKLLLIAVAVAVLMDGMDGSVVNVALPAIATAFGTDTSSISWVIVLYFMTLAGLILVFGRIADRGALKKVFVYGFTIFTVASFMCGVSNSLPMLLVSRTLQGVGGAMIAASGPMLCVKYISMKKMGFALSMITLGSSVGYAIGPVLGGILTEYLSWHWIFLINIPIGALAIPFAIHVIPKDGPIEKRPLDLLGSTFMFGAIATGILALERLSNPDALNIVVVSAILCVIFLILFILRELSFDKPVIDVRIFKSGKFSAVLLSFILFNLTYMGPFYLIPFYMSLCLGFSSVTMGLYLFISSLITALICLPVGRLSDKTGRRWISILGISMLLTSAVLLLFINVENGYLILVPTVVLMGASWGLCGGPMAARVVEHAPAGNEGIGSSISSLAIYLGMGIGTATFAAYFSIFTGAQGSDFASLTVGEFAAGLHAAMLLAILLAAIALILAAVIRDTDKVGSKKRSD